MSTGLRSACCPQTPSPPMHRTVSSAQCSGNGRKEWFCSPPLLDRQCGPGDRGSCFNRQPMIAKNGSWRSLAALWFTWGKTLLQGLTFTIHMSNLGCNFHAVHVDTQACDFSSGTHRLHAQEQFTTLNRLLTDLHFSCPLQG